MSTHIFPYKLSLVAMRSSATRIIMKATVRSLHDIICIDSWTTEAESVLNSIILMFHETKWMISFLN